MIERYRRISRISVGVLVTILLAVFTLTLAGFYTRVPSDGMSRELVLADLDSGKTSSSDRRVVVIPASDGESATVAAIDGTHLLLLEVNEQGDVLERSRIPEDFGNSTHLTGYWNSAGRLVLFHGGSSLTRLEMNSFHRVRSRREITGRIEAFEGAGGRLAILTREGLFLWSDAEARLEGPVLTGDITRIEADGTGDQTTVAAVTKVSDSDIHSVTALDFNDRLDIVGRLTLLEDNRDEQLRKLRDIRVREGSLSLLYLFRDNRYGINYLNIRRFDRNSGEELFSTVVEIPIVTSRYNLIGDGAGGETFIMRFRTLYGDNLAECDIRGTSEPTITPLTKTRDMSLEAGNVEIGGHRVLIFSDYSKDSAQIALASTHPELVRRTTRLSETDWGMILGTAATHFLVALFASWIYLLIAVPPSAIVLGVVQRHVKTTIANFHILVALGAVGYTFLKFFVTDYFLGTTDMSHLFFPGLGLGAGLYWALAFMSLVSYGITTFSFRPMMEKQGTILESYIRFAITDGILYSAMFLIYGITAMLLVKM